MERKSYIIPLLLRHLQLMGIKCDPKELQLVLQSAPTFPSVLSIVQTYTYFGIKANAYQADFSALEKASAPAIAQIKQGRTDRLVLIYIVSATIVIYYDALTNKKIEISREQFCKIWTGIIVLTEKTSDTFFMKQKAPYIEFFVSISLILICLWVNSAVQSISFICVLLGLKSVGVWFTVGLFYQNSKNFYSFFDTFCHKNEMFDCTAVSKSKGSMLLKKIKLEDIGFVYFSTGIISLLIGIFSYAIISVLQFLLYLSVCSILIVLFSIFYQMFVVKKWCLLCLGVISILTMEAILFHFYPFKLLSGDFILTIKLLLFSLCSSLGILYLLKKYMLKQVEIFNADLLFLRFKRSHYVILSAFKSQRVLLPMDDSLVIGNADASVVITTFLNLKCDPCKEIAFEMIKLLKRYPSFIQWHIRFDGIATQKYHEINKVQLSIYDFFQQQSDMDKRLKIMKDWAASHSNQSLSRKCSFGNVSDETVLSFSAHVRNNDRLEVETLPSIWLNNRFFPKEYLVKDIPFFLTDTTVLKELQNNYL